MPQVNVNNRSGQKPRYVHVDPLPNLGVTRTEKFIYDHSGNVLTKVITEDVEPVIDFATNIRNNTKNGFTKEGDMRLIGTLPMVVLDQWFKEGFNPFRGDSKENSKEIKRRLNDFNKFRTVDGML